MLGQIFLDEVQKAESKTVSKFFAPGQGDQSPSLSMMRNSGPEIPAARRNEEGFWVEFKSVDLGHTSNYRRLTQSDPQRNYGTDDYRRSVHENFVMRSLERLQTVGIGLGLVVTCYGLWRLLVSLGEVDDYYR